MKGRSDILEELQLISPLLAGLPKINVFSIPTGYFDRLPNHILQSVQEQHSISFTVDNINKQPEADVPVGYFDTLADNILQKIKNQSLESTQAELQELSPTLSAIQKKNVWSVPEGYFNNLSEVIFSKISRPAGKVFSLKRYESFSMVKYAVAAIFVGVMALGVLKFTGQHNDSNNLPSYVAAAQKIQNIDEEMEKIDDEDIIQYLEANGEDVDMGLVSNMVDDKSLPNEEDYLLDEKTLDNYLENVN